MAVFVHGGAWKSLDRRYFTWLTGPFDGSGAALARLGFVTAVVGYRQAPEGSADDGLRDVAQAVAWMQQHAAELGGDPRRVVLVGHSGGALLAGRLAYDPSLLRTAGADPGGIVAVALLAGLHDVEQMPPSLAAGDSDSARRFYGETPAARSAWRLQPLLKADSPTTVLLGAGDDEPALVAQHHQLAADLKAAGVAHTAEVLAGEGHMALAPKGDAAVAGKLAQWLAGTPRLRP
jgi:acetyl esterase/lipase